MPQLYCQLASRPGPWLLGRTSAGLCTLQTACPLTVTYSGGSPAADTIASGSAATVYGGSAAAFDVSADVWVVLTVPASGALQVVKEADLATLTGDWAGLARIVQHAVEPYQPQAYLGAGGLGALTPATQTVTSDPLAARALSLWTGSANSSPPSGWHAAGFDDSAWLAAITAAQIADPSGAVPVGATTIWASQYPQADTEQVLLRQSFVLPTGVVTAASLQVNSDEDLGGVWINGTLLSGSADSSGVTEAAPHAFDVPPALLHAGGRNLIASYGKNVHGAAGTLLADDTFSDPGGGNPGRSYYTAALAAGYAALSAHVSNTATWSGAGSMENETGSLWWNALLSTGPYTFSDPNAAATTDGTKRFLVQTNNGGPSTQHVQVYGNGAAWVAYTLTITYVGTGAVGDPGGTEGDLLYYHDGAWVDLPIGTSGQVLKSDGTDPGWAAAAAGTVTSVALAGPTGTTVSGSPVTSSGTLTLSWASQAANTMLAAPNGSSGAPTFRVLAAGDIPSLPASQIGSGQLAAARGGTGVDGSAAANGALPIGNGSGYSLATLTAGSNITITNGAGTITIASTAGGSGTVTSVALTVPAIFNLSGSPITTSGTLAVTLATQSAATVFAGPSSGSAAAPTFRAIAASDLPPAAAAGGHVHAHGHFL